MDDGSESAEEAEGTEPIFLKLGGLSASAVITYFVLPALSTIVRAR